MHIFSASTELVVQLTYITHCCVLWQAFVVSGQGSMPMTEYPYPTSAATDTRIYRPQQPAMYPNVHAEESFAPLTYSYSSSQYPADTSSPQVMTSGSSFDDDPSAVKERRPKKGKKKGGQGVAASIDEKEAMMSVGYSSAAGGSESFSCLFTCTLPQQMRKDLF